MLAKCLTLIEFLIETFYKQQVCHTFTLVSAASKWHFMLLCRIPFYYEMKILAILWLVSPASNGCLIVYKKVVAPLFQTRERVSCVVVI